MASQNMVNIGPGNGLSSAWRQVITWNNRPLGIYVSEILI